MNKKNVFGVVAYFLFLITRALGAGDISQPVVITEPGQYVVLNDMVGTITIASDNVQLDLGGNTISGGGQGIYIAQQAQCTIKHGTIENMQEGIFIDSCTSIMIREITARANVNGIVTQSTENLVIDMNIFLNNTESGMSITACPGVQVANNQCDGNATSIDMQHSDGVYIAYNTTSNNMNDGLSAIACNNAFLIDNLCQTSTRAIYMQDSVNGIISRNKSEQCYIGIYLDAGTSNNELNFNQCVNCTINAYDLGSGNRFVYNQV